MGCHSSTGQVWVVDPVTDVPAAIGFMSDYERWHRAIGNGALNDGTQVVWKSTIGEGP